jgi:nucleotide-binding universal stress UspA family protein
MSSTHHVICGLDGSHASRRAAATALRLADGLGDRLVLVHVLPHRPSMTAAALPVGAHPVGTGDVRELDRSEAGSAFASLEGIVSPASADRVVERGQAADRLSAAASERDARLIVVGTRRRGILRAAFLGSVSAELSARASRPVGSGQVPDRFRAAAGRTARRRPA